MVKDEFGGDLEDALVGLLAPSVASYYASQLNKAMKGMGVNEDTIIRILGANDKNTCREIAEAYYKAYDKRLVDSLGNELDGNLKRAVVNWIQKPDPQGHSEGQEKAPLDLMASLASAIAERDADEIHAACKGWGTDESRVVSVVCARSKPHLLNVDIQHRTKYGGQTLSELLQSECSGDLKKLLKYLLMPEVVYDYYTIDKACKGFGTNEGLLIEALASRPGERILKARAKFDARGRPLIDIVNNELSGDLKKIALTLIEGRSDAPADEDLAQSQAEQLYDAGMLFTFEAHVHVIQIFFF